MKKILIFTVLALSLALGNSALAQDEGEASPVQLNCQGNSQSPKLGKTASQTFVRKLEVIIKLMSDR